MYKNILLAYDGSEIGRLALREGARLAQICSAEVFLLAVLPTPSVVVAGLAAVGGGVLEIDEQQRDAYDGVLAEGVRRLKRMGFSPRQRISAGDPGKEIYNVAQEIRADLVVVGHNKHSAISRLFHSSTSNYLIGHLDCSVLVARLEISDEALFTERPLY